MNANINIAIELKETMSIKSLEELLKAGVNPIIDIIKTYLLNSGYDMNLFNSLYDNNIDIHNILYNAYISIDKNINCCFETIL